MESPKIRITRFKIAAASLLLSGFCISSSCDNCPQPHNIAASQLASREKSATPPTSNQLVVYLDTSLSMAGYVPRKREVATTFSRTLQEVRNFITLVSPPVDVVVRRVDARVGAPLNNTVLSQASVDNSFFNGSETDLAGAFDVFPMGTGVGGSSDSPPRFHILVTDGVQSTNQQRPDLLCTAGSDQLCVRKKIFDLLNRGWGGCIIGVRSEFDGKVYSEINRATGRVSALQYRSDDNDSQTFRPFYLYVFSPDRNALEPFVASLLDRLKPLVGKHSESLRLLPLSFQYAEASTQAKVNSTTRSNGVVVRKSERSDIPEFTVEVNSNTAKTGPQPISIEITIPWSRALLGGNAQSDLAGVIQWELKPIYTEKPNPAMRFPEIKYVEAQVDSAGRITLHLTAQWLPNQVGKMCWRGYRLEGRLKPENQTPDWVREWSTNLDTTRENGNKTLYLESTLLGLWRNEVLSNQLVAEAVVLAGEP